ncbi:MAG: PrsW family intramembrane metalloprotease [Firmicutes bacterium]|nr:PrsW family intramembrane metalloprotease [Bacillota bacterium]
MWRLIFLALVSLIPALGWAWFFREQDAYEKEPLRLILLCFALGMLAVLPAILLEDPFRISMDQGSVKIRLLLAFLVVGLGEEGLKLLAAYIAVYRREDFSEIVDGMVYSMAAALGFAAVENLLYTITFGIQIAPARALISSLAHGAFSGLAGYHLGLAKFRSKNPTYQVFVGLFSAAFLHGLYNSLLTFELVSTAGIMVFLTAIYWLVFQRFKRALALSPYHNRRSD